MSDLRFTAMPMEGPITQEFGITSVTGSRHGGVDIGGPTGRLIRWTGAEPARVHAIHIWKQPHDWAFGTWVCIDAVGTPYYVAYAHLSRVAEGLAAGQTIQPGALIGYCGETGLAFGAHLHWAVGRDPSFPLDFGQLRDPMEFVRADAPGKAVGEEQEEDMARIDELAKEIDQIREVLTGFQGKGFLGRVSQEVVLASWARKPPKGQLAVWDEHPPSGWSLLAGYRDVKENLLPKLDLRVGGLANTVGELKTEVAELATTLRGLKEVADELAAQVTDLVTDGIEVAAKALSRVLRHSSELLDQETGG